MSLPNAETVYLHEQGVTVTASRLILPRQTYQISHLLSVRQRADDGRFWSIVWAAVLFFLALGVGGVMVGYASQGQIAAATGAAMTTIIMGVVCALCIHKAWTHRAGHSLLLTTTAREMPVLWSHDAAFVERVVKAVDRALARQ